MKCVSFESFIVGTPPPGAGGRYFLFVKLTTDNGITGYGEIYAGHMNPTIIMDLARDSFARYLEGKSPFQIEKFIRSMHGAGFLHRPDYWKYLSASGCSGFERQPVCRP